MFSTEHSCQTQIIATMYYLSSYKMEKIIPSLQGCAGGKTKKNNGICIIIFRAQGQAISRLRRNVDFLLCLELPLLGLEPCFL